MDSELKLALENKSQLECLLKEYEEQLTEAEELVITANQIKERTEASILKINELLKECCDWIDKYNKAV